MRDHDACEDAINDALARGQDGHAEYLATRCDLVHGDVTQTPQPAVAAPDRGVVSSLVEPEATTTPSLTGAPPRAAVDLAERVAALVHPNVARVRQYRGKDSPVDHDRVRHAAYRFRPGQPLGWVMLA